MWQLVNKTPFAAQMVVLANEHGIDTLYVAVKASFQIGPKWVLLEEQVPPTEVDEYWGEPGESSIKSASDLLLDKPSTDVIVVGDACAPEGKQARRLDVEVDIAGRRKLIRVFGDRYWQGGRISEPEPFQTMPMVYERAFGGTHIVDEDIVAAEVRNMVGTGFAGKRKAKEMEGVALPNLEDPRQLIEYYQDTPPPACFAAVSPNWKPRAAYVGTYDDAWVENRAPFYPLDFDKRFLNVATPELTFRDYLQGGEPVRISGMHPQGPLQFSLPVVRPLAKVCMSKAEHLVNFNLESVIVEPSRLELSLVWKGVYPLDKAKLKVEEVVVSLQRG